MFFFQRILNSYGYFRNIEVKTTMRIKLSKFIIKKAYKCI